KIPRRARNDRQSNFMKLKDSIQTATRGLKHAKLRSFLTMLGIVIGIGSVILLMSIGSSAQQLILNQVKSVGSNLIFVIPGATESGRFSSPAAAQGIVIKTLTQRDLDALAREPSITEAAAEVHGQADVVYQNNDAVITYEGVTANFISVRNFGISKGSAFGETDVQSFNHVAVIGSALAKTLFGAQEPVGKVVRLKNVSFKVIGVLAPKGTGPGGVDQDNIVIIPMSVAQKQLLGINYFSIMSIQADDAYTIDFVKERIKQILRENHGITNSSKDDFTIMTQEDLLSILGNITSILQIFLTAIASISLVVGGIGIMNIMYVSVVERTREIGLRKAVGATSRDIMQQFLTEAVILTSLGGVIGIAVGALFTVLIYFGVTYFASIGWVFSLPISAILLAAAVSTVIGVVFGIYPAYRASKLSPTEALRYE
ncbi:MAG: ABC transporter permease, partial [Candidatus Liptonbacteria bacterium]|nr:ABC transporter permease [Candidatus Liptonbacteria bacterium]